jgi:rod shape-determining protein MreD
VNLQYKRLSFVLTWTLFIVLCIPVLFPGWRLMAFAPCLVIIYYQKSYLASLWLSTACGLFLDVLSSHSNLGLYAVSFCLTTAVLYGQQKHFFADSLSTLPLMTFLFSFISTIIQAIMLYVFEAENIFSWAWAATDLLIMPLLDALYAFVCFLLPAVCFGKPQRRGKDYFMER